MHPLLFILLLVLAASPAPAEDWILTASPLYSLPIGAQEGVFTSLSLGGTLSASLPFSLFGLSWLTPEVGLGYVYSGLGVTSSSLSALEVQAGLAARFPMAAWVDLRAQLAARLGYYMLSADPQSTNGTSPGVGAGLGADFRVSPTFSLGVGAQGVYDFGMYFFVRPYVSASLRIGGGAAPGTVEPRQETPARPAPLEETSGAAGSGSWILTASPLYSFPIGAQDGVFTPLSLGGTLSASLPFALFGLSWLTPEVGLGYVYSGLDVTSSSLSALEVQAGLAARFPMVAWVDLRAQLAARLGYYLLSADPQSTNGASPGVGAGLGVDFRVSPTFSLGLGAQGVYDFGMYFFVRPYISASLRIGGGAAQETVEPKQEPPARPAPLTGESAEKPQPAAIEGDAVEVAVDGVFPVFYKYYENHPFGTVTVSNRGKSRWTDVKVTFSVKQFMDLETTLPVVASIAPGQAVKLDLVTLFNDSILSVTEATKITGELLVEYKENGKTAQLSRSVSLRVYDRNAMTWTDDRRAAAFVTAKDPAILTFAKSLAGDVSASKNPAISDKLQVAAAVHEALIIYGVNYVRDPTSIFSGAKAKSEVDFLQFPRQTLEYRAGDCDDLSILYSAFFEAVGIESAFVTVPGHIFVAVSLDMTPEEAKGRFGRFDDLISQEGKTWLPIEITMRKGGFLAAWTEGAKEWRESSARGQAVFSPVRSAWELYEPVALPGSSNIPPLQNAKAIDAMKADVESFVASEIAERVARLQADSRKAQGASKAINALGILYAQYGLYDKAAAQFQSVLSKVEYVPSLVNLGYIHKARGESEAALVYFDRAFKKAPTSVPVLLAEATINHELENYGAVRKFYLELKKRDPALADRYAYLDLRGSEGAKAADAAGLRNMIDWVEEQ